MVGAMVMARAATPVSSTDHKARKAFKGKKVKNSKNELSNSLGRARFVDELNRITLSNLRIICLSRHLRQ
ncbi:MAG: hypothetical protein MUF47_03940 [Porphyrobacter sp.]|nr:hypothetical protein [Porphyrobacter sp.]